MVKHSSSNPIMENKNQNHCNSRWLKMVEKVYALSEADRRAIADMLARTTKLRVNSPVGLNPDSANNAPAVYIVKGAVPARSCQKCQTTTGSGSEQTTAWRFVAGKATLPVYKLQEDGVCGWVLVPVEFNGTPLRLECFNVRGFDTSSDFSIIKRDAFGRWLVEFSREDDPCSSSSSSGSSESESDSSESDSSESESSDSSDSSDSSQSSDSSSFSSSSDSSESSSGSGSGSSSGFDCISVVTDVTWNGNDVDVTKMTICCVCAG